MAGWANFSQPSLHLTTGQQPEDRKLGWAGLCHPETLGCELGLDWD